MTMTACKKPALQMPMRTIATKWQAVGPDEPRHRRGSGGRVDAQSGSTCTTRQSAEWVSLREHCGRQM